MARPRDSRSPSDAGSHHSSRRPRRDDDRSDRARGRDGRGYRPRSRSRSPNPRFRDNRGPRGGQDRDHYRRRDRSLDRRDDDYHRSRRRDSRERRRSRDRTETRPRSPPHGRERARDGPRDGRRRDDSRDRVRGRPEGTTDSHGGRAHDEGDGRRTSPANGNRTRDEKPKPAPPKSEATILAERQAKLEAWKKRKATEAQKQKDVNAAQTRDILAEMDRKAIDSATVTPGVSAAASPAPPESGSASPAATYAGKFDPKAIAKKSSAAKSLEKGVLGLPLDVQPNKLSVPQKQMPTASALPSNRAKTSGFGFAKAQDTDKLPSKMKLDLDEEDKTERKLTKLPTLPETADETPYADQDENDESGGDEFAENEEEAAAAARALHEKRIQADNEDEKVDVDMTDVSTTQPETKGSAVQATGQPTAQPSTVPGDKMEVDEEDDDVDPLDAYMAGLSDEIVKGPPKASKTAGVVEPEAYFSDDEYTMQEDTEGALDAKKLQAIANKRKKKDIPQVDYRKVELQPIRKNFWAEPAELANLTEADLTDLRLELDGIKVIGENVPKPVQKWAHCGLSRATLDTLAGLGFEKPTPIQMQAIPAIMSGRDVIGVAKTGSGKTIAFLLPMFRHIKDQPPLKDMDGPVGLIMAPTRELAVQIHRDCKPFLGLMGLRAVCGYGGAPIKDQIAELKRGAEILVCTPGRLIDLLTANQGRVTNLRRVTYAVLDEADRMFDMGFEPQVMKIFNNMRPDKQTILFSATMPRIVDSLIKKVLHRPVEITVGGRSVVAKEIEQLVEIREESAKFVRVLGLLGKLYDTDEDARTLIFVERQEKADDLLKELMTKGYPCMSIHGGKDQVDRDSTISDFKNGIIPILIATSIAARGLDVKQLKLVINYDAPNHLEDYVHRAGRTGRAGNTGVAVTFITPDQEHCAVGICKALEQSEQPVPPKLDEMRKAHREKVKSGKAKDNSGFGGKGLDRLDQDREAARNRERKTHRAEGEEEEDKEDKKEDDEAKFEKALGAIKAAASSIQARTTASIESKISAIKPGREGDTPAGAAAGGNNNANNPLEKVSSAVSAINTRLGKSGQLRSGQPIDNKGPDAGAFHATLEINDFPQKARWAVTNRTNVAKILDATGTSITTKGNFYPPGKEPPQGESKLYILIEGDTEVAVAAALNDLTRLLREGTIAAADADSRAPASGRYTVT